MNLLNALAMTTEVIASTVLILSWLVVMRSTRYSKWQVAVISLPGTFMHVKRYMDWSVYCFLPSPDHFQSFQSAKGTRGCSVQLDLPISISGTQRRLPFVPVLMLGIGWPLFQYLMLPSFLTSNYLIWLASGYVVACSLFSCMPSATDFEAGALSGLMYGCIGFGVWQFFHSH